jgi:hypothetical protein
MTTALPLFIYGSLRDPRVRDQLLGPRPDLTTCPATLPGHVRLTVESFGYPFLVPVRTLRDAAVPADAQVAGELLLGLLPADYVTLDRYEDLDDGLYLRGVVTVETAAGPADAFAYLRGPNAPLS